MVEAYGRKKNSLYIAAWSPVWNAKPKDSKGRIPSGRKYDCRVCALSRNGDLPRRLGCESDKPGGGFYLIGTEKLKTKRCPQSVRRFADSQLSAIFETSDDYESSNVHGWPDQYAGAISEGVRWYLGHRGAAYEHRRAG